MNLASVDLNLLVALDSLLLEASVSRAATRIGLSQPATSHALQRLRDLFGDPLLLRVGARMELTPRAQALRAPLGEVLENLRGLIKPEGFTPGNSERRFRAMIPDIIAELLLPAIMNRLAAEAPNVRLVVVPWRTQFDMTAEFERSLDLIISYVADDSAADPFETFHRVALYSDSDVLAVRQGHPAAKRLSSRDGFAAARHVAIVGRGQREDPIDGWLRAKRLSRQIALVVPGYIQALHVVAQTDLVAFVPRRLAAAMAKQLALKIIASPIDPGTDRQHLFYPARAQHDPASIWLRRLVLDAAKRLR